MVVIRLTRIGKKKQAFYRVVAADSKRPVKAKFIEILGWYNPHSKEINIKTDRVNDWLQKGAQPSNTVAKLLKSESVKLPDWVEIKEKNKRSKNEKPIVEEKPEAKPKSDETAEEAQEPEQAEVPKDEESNEPAAEESTASE